MVFSRLLLLHVGVGPVFSMDVVGWFVGVMCCVCCIVVGCGGIGCVLVVSCCVWWLCVCVVGAIVCIGWCCVGCLIEVMVNGVSMGFCVGCKLFGDSLSNGFVSGVNMLLVCVLCVVL